VRPFHHTLQALHYTVETRPGWKLVFSNHFILNCNGRKWFVSIPSPFVAAVTTLLSFKPVTAFKMAKTQLNQHQVCEN